MIDVLERKINEQLTAYIENINMSNNYNEAGNFLSDFQLYKNIFLTNLALFDYLANLVLWIIIVPCQ